MRGLVGLYKFDAAAVCPGDLDRLTAAVWPPSEQGQRPWIASSMGLAGHPFITPDGCAVSFDGRLDNRDELTADRYTDPGRPPSAVPDVAYVAAAYETTGDRFVSQLNGDFALALCDPAGQMLVLARDVMGARRLHYTQIDRTLYFATDIKALLACPGVTPVPNEDALADLVLDRWIDPHRTCFKGIFSVPPGHLLVARPHGIEVREHWAFDPARQIRFTTFDDYEAAFREIFERSVQRRMRGARQTAITVSGGLDSSSIFCVAAAFAKQSGNPAPHGLSMTFAAGSPADEQQFLDGIESGTGLAIERIPVSELDILSDAETAVDQLELPDLVWDAHRAIYQRARERGCTVILDGYYGDQAMFPRNYLLDLAWHGRWLQLHRTLREFGSGVEGATHAYKREFGEILTRSLLPRRVFLAIKQRAAHRRAKRYPGCYTKGFVERVLDRQMTRFDTDRRFPTWHAEGCFRDATAGHYLLHFERQSRTAAAEGVTVASPFRDRDLVAFVMAIPGEIVNWNGVPKGLLRQAMKGLLPLPIHERRSKADFTPLLNRAALRHFEIVRRRLTRKAMVVSGGFVEGDRIEAAVRDYQSRIASDDQSAVAAWRITELAAFEIWLRRFFGSGIAGAAVR